MCDRSPCIGPLKFHTPFSDRSSNTRYDLAWSYWLSGNHDAEPRHVKTKLTEFLSVLLWDQLRGRSRYRHIMLSPASSCWGVDHYTTYDTMSYLLVWLRGCMLVLLLITIDHAEECSESLSMDRKVNVKQVSVEGIGYDRVLLNTYLTRGTIYE